MTKDSMCASQQCAYDPCRVLLVRNGASEILLENVDDRFRVPVVPIRRYQRIAEEITTAIDSMWNLKTYCLFAESYDNSVDPFLRCQVMETSQTNSEPPAGMRWFTASSLSSSAFKDSRDFVAVETSRQSLEKYRRGELLGAFAKPGWLGVVMEWVATQAAAHGLTLSGQFRQLNASPTFSLIRFETNGPALWFKAVGEPNVKEYSLTRLLADLIPTFVPRLVASNPRWNAWLSWEAEGAHLTERSRMDEWLKAAAALANLQVASFGNAQNLIEAGCQDMRICTLQKLVDPLFKRLGESMELQSKSTPSALDPIELSSLATEIHSVLRQLGASEFPNVLGHLDFNPGNVLVSEESCTFIDWAEGSVGHPLCTLAYLLELLRRLYGIDPILKAALISAYSDPWKFLVSPKRIVADLAVAPLLAVFTHAASIGLQQTPGLATQTECATYLHALTRRMKREVDALAGRRFACTT